MLLTGEKLWVAYGRKPGTSIDDVRGHLGSVKMMGSSDWHTHKLEPTWAAEAVVLKPGIVL
jgi:hypothetical protein